MQAAFKELEHAMVVMAHLEKQQTEHIRDLREFQHRTEQNLAEITDKLNSLTGLRLGPAPGRKRPVRGAKEKEPTAWPSMNPAWLILSA
jgi:hypothetical protein